MSQSIAVNTFIASTGRAVNIALGIVVTAALTRYLGVEQYGSYILLFSYGTVLQIIADFGLYLTLTREIARRPHQEQEVFSLISSLRLVFLVAIFLVGAILSSVPSYRPLVIPYFIMAAGLVFQSLSQLLMGVYQKHGLVWRATVGDLLGRLAQLGGILLFPLVVTSYWLPVTSYPLLYMAGTFTLGAAAAYLLHALLAPAVAAWRLKVNWAGWKEIVTVSWPLGAMLLLNAIYFRIDIMILSWWHPGAAVGWYGLAYRIIESGLFFPAMFGGLLLPQISARVISNIAGARALLEQSLHFIIVAAAGCAVIVFSLARPAVIWLSGVSYAPAGPLLQILSGALFVMFLGNIFGFTLVALGKHKQLLVLYAALAISNAVANLIFIPRYGAAAAAWTTVATEILAVSAAAWLVGRGLPYKLSGRVVILVVGITLATWLLSRALPSSWPVLVHGGVLFSFYLALGVWVGVIRRQHINLLLTSR